MVHKAGKKVFFHTDGNITDLYEEFIEIGVDAINSQLFCMDIEDLAKRFKGRITFWGEIDRQRILPFGSPDDAYRAVARVRKALDDGRGGVIGQCQWGIRNPPENIAAVFEAWDMPLPELLARTEGRVAAPPPSGANAATPAKVSSPFIEAEYRRYARGGNATLTGVASMKTAGGEVKPGAACVVTVVPATPYTRERFRLMSQYPRAQLEAPDSRLEAYTRTAVADANGKFTCDHLPAGDYILTCTIRWQYVGRMGLTTAKGQAVAYATVSEHQTKEVQLSG